MALEKFTESARSYRPKVSIRSNGTFGFSHGAVSKWKLDRYSHVVLYYDRDEKIVGIRPTKTDEDGAHKLNLSRSKKGAWVSARRFLDYFGISTQLTERYDAEWDEEEKMIRVKIS